MRIFPHKVDWETAGSLYCCCLSSETLIEMMDRFQVRFNHGCDCFRSYWTEKNKIDETHGLLGTAERSMCVLGTLSISLAGHRPGNGGRTGIVYVYGRRIG